jgi:hypothetical protein
MLLQDFDEKKCCRGNYHDAIPILTESFCHILNAYPQLCHCIYQDDTTTLTESFCHMLMIIHMYWLCNFQDATPTITESFCHLLKACPVKNFKKEQKMSNKITIFDFKEYEC